MEEIDPPSVAPFNSNESSNAPSNASIDPHSMVPPPERKNYPMDPQQLLLRMPNRYSIISGGVITAVKHLDVTAER